MYREKYERVLPILEPVLDVAQPDGGFYLWPDVPIDDEIFTRDLFATQNLTILPGSYLARTSRDGLNPGKRRVRISLVASVDECVTAAQRIRSYLETI
jgi:N-succinyldiaminopimelate aminotransferase